MRRKIKISNRCGKRQKNSKEKTVQFLENNILDTNGKTGKPVSEVSNFVIVRQKIHIKNGTYYFDERRKIL